MELEASALTPTFEDEGRPSERFCEALVCGETPDHGSMRRRAVAVHSAFGDRVESLVQSCQRQAIGDDEVSGERRTMSHFASPGRINRVPSSANGLVTLPSAEGAG